MFDGKEAVLEYPTTVVTNFSQNRLTDVRITVSADGGTVFLEANGDLIQAGTGLPYRNVYVFKFVDSDGLITHISEYANPIPIAELFGLPLGSSGTAESGDTTTPG